MSRSVLILGAGLGGVVAAEALRKLLPAEDRVTVVDRAESHLFPPSLLWLMVGTRAAGDFSRPIARLAGRGIEVLRGEVTRIDPQAVAAEIDAKKISADAMVIALGAAYAPEAIPGLAEAGLSFYTLEGAAAIHAELEKFSGGRLVVLTAAPQYKCPAGPYEAALLAEDFLARKGVRGSTEIDFYAAEPAPMVVAGPEMGRAVRGLIEGRGIRYHPEHQVASVEAASRTLRFANGATAQFDLLLYVPPHRAPAPVREAGLTNELGWVPVDRHTLQTSRWAARCRRRACSRTAKPRWSRTTSRTPGPAKARRGASTAAACASSRRAAGAPAWVRAISTPSRCRASRCAARACCGTPGRCCTRSTGSGAGSRAYVRAIRLE